MKSIEAAATITSKAFKGLAPKGKMAIFQGVQQFHSTRKITLICNLAKNENHLKCY
jgi:hypothetical protein